MTVPQLVQMVVIELFEVLVLELELVVGVTTDATSSVEVTSIVEVTSVVEVTSMVEVSVVAIVVSVVKAKVTV